MRQPCAPFGCGPNIPNLKSFDPGIAMEFTEPIHFIWDRQTESKADFFKRVNRVSGTRRLLNKEHAQWLALYQFAGLSPADIRKRFAPNKGTDEDPSVILRGCETAADRLGIPLRQGRRGRARRK